MLTEYLPPNTYQLHAFQLGFKGSAFASALPLLRGILNIFSVALRKFQDDVIIWVIYRYPVALITDHRLPITEYRIPITEYRIPDTDY